MALCNIYVSVVYATANNTVPFPNIMIVVACFAPLSVMAWIDVSVRLEEGPRPHRKLLQGAKCVVFLELLQASQLQYPLSAIPVPPSSDLEGMEYGWEPG
jgi:hypothetical protein